MHRISRGSGGSVAVSFGTKAGMFPRGATRAIRVIPSVPVASKALKSIYNPIRCSGMGPTGGGGTGGGDGNENFWRDDFGDGEPKRRFDSISFVLGLIVLGIPSFYFKAMRDRRKKKKEEERGYDSDPIHALKRLVRELFEKDVDVRQRLSAVEERLGIIRDDEDAPGMQASRVSSPHKESSGAHRNVDVQRSGSGVMRSVGGRLVLGGGLLWSGGDPESTVDPLVETGMQLGTSLTLQTRGQFRQGKDFILADVDIDGSSDDQFNLQKVLYSFGLSPHVRLMFAPFGARGNDVTYTLNPFSGRGLTAGTSEGNPLLHDRGRGSVVGATLSSSRLWCTGAYFKNEGEEAEDKALVQLLAAPTKALSIGVSLLESQQEDGGSGLVRYATEFLTSRISNENSDRSSSATPMDAVEVSTSFALSLRQNLAVHGWMASDSPGSMMNANTTTWNISVGDTVADGFARWVASMGKSMVNTSSNAVDMRPDTLEFSTEFDLGNGMACHPGMVAVRQGETWTVLAGAKAVWDF